MSKLINQSRLQQFATKLWDKIKDRYDDAFIDAAIPTEAKKITFTKRKNGATKDVSLEDYARLQDRNEFKEDVSADNVAITNNKYIGTGTSNNIVFDSKNRSVGFRQLTTSAFADSYVDHIRIYVDSTPTRTDSIWTVWAITKDADNRDNDRVAEVICNSKTLEVNSITEGSAVNKFVKIPITRSFEHETYFIARCTTHNLQVLRNVKQEYSNDSINMNASQPPTNPDATINWNSGDNTPNNTAIMYLFGRESIGSLALKLNKTQADSSLYVKYSETVNTGGRDNANKVVKLDDAGKLSESMLPSIAINEYIEVAAFDHTTLLQQRYENGDVVVVNSTGNPNNGKRYLCIKKDKNSNDLTEGFVELNSKDGVVTSVNELRGDINLALAAEEEKVKLNITSGGVVKSSELQIITNDDIDRMIAALPN